MRIAVCLFGLVGNIVGKSGTSTIGADQVLKLSYKHWDDKIIKENTQIDFFIHSWSCDLQSEIDGLFKPVLSKYEPQRTFDIPEHITGTDLRKQSHYSRWYSTQQSMKLKRQYEEKHDFRYDWVMSARFDIAWKKPVKFDRFTNKRFYYGGWDRDGSIKVIDFWFFSNSINMDNFCDLYDSIDDYAIDNKNSRQISSHSLASRRMDKLGFKTKLIFKYGHFTDPTKSDYPLVRYEYFKALN